MEKRESKYSKFNDKLNSIPIDVFKTKNKEQEDRDEKDFQDLKDALSRGMCSYCGNPVTHFSVRKPCFHWLLWQAKGLRKKFFSLLFIEKGFHEIEAYLRWVANCEKPLSNINNLKEEQSATKLIEITICYKNLEWSFSCSNGDFEGHKDKRDGKFPHYHMQMKIDGNVVINYNGYHIPFNDYDEFCFAVERGEFDRLKAGHIHGAGMQELLDNFSPDELIGMMKKSNGETNGQFDLSTMLIADEGTTISGDAIAELFDEHKRTGIPMAKLVQKLKNVKMTTFITPGPSVPEIAARKKNRKRKH